MEEFKKGDRIIRINDPSGDLPKGTCHTVESIPYEGAVTLEGVAGRYHAGCFKLVVPEDDLQLNDDCTWSAKTENPTPEYYNYEYKGIKLDPYRIMKIYGVTDSCQDHALKKLLRVHVKSHKSKKQEIKEVIDTLTRWQQMLEEDEE